MRHQRSRSSSVSRIDDIVRSKMAAKGVRRASAAPDAGSGDVVLAAASFADVHTDAAEGPGGPDRRIGRDHRSDRAGDHPPYRERPGDRQGTSRRTGDPAHQHARGLATSMREIIADLLASPVPVVGYVAPPALTRERGHVHPLRDAYRRNGAWNEPGSRHPVQIGGPLPGCRAARTRTARRERTARSRPAGAGSHDRKGDERCGGIHPQPGGTAGRNVDWAEQAVREAATLSAQAALGEARHRRRRTQPGGASEQDRRPGGGDRRRAPAPAHRRCEDRDHRAGLAHPPAGGDHQPQHRLR